MPPCPAQLRQDPWVVGRQAEPAGKPAATQSASVAQVAQARPAVTAQKLAPAVVTPQTQPMPKPLQPVLSLKPWAQKSFLIVQVPWWGARRQMSFLQMPEQHWPPRWHA